MGDIGSTENEGHRDSAARAWCSRSGKQHQPEAEGCCGFAIADESVANRNFEQYAEFGSGGPFARGAESRRAIAPTATNAIGGSGRGGARPYHAEATRLTGSGLRLPAVTLIIYFSRRTGHQEGLEFTGRFATEARHFGNLLDGRGAEAL